VYDNTNANRKSFANHSSRKEVQDALMYGSGYSISRQSESIQGEEYFYSARYYPPYRIIIRSALPYNLSLAEHLQADSGYLWFALIICLVLIFIFYRFTRKLGKSITKLQQFAMKADRNEPIDMDILQTFPKNELGEISQHIIKIYKRLHRAKEALYIEREKLISHLQTSHEGLGVFTKERQEILVNNLFTQYINNISDRNLRSTNEIFDIPELQPIIEFLNRNEGNFSKEEKRYIVDVLCKQVVDQDFLPLFGKDTQSLV
jgi:two-component system OmpR family sensor kinase/two-component system phosphate regulon sensor histidine kinase PhoR